MASFAFTQGRGHHLCQVPYCCLEPVLRLSLAVRELRGLPNVGAVLSNALNNHNSTEGQQTLWTDLCPVWERVGGELLPCFGGWHAILSKLEQQ